MKFTLLSIVFCAAICIASATKLIASSSHQLNRRENSLLNRLVKRQAYGAQNCDRRACAVPNCGKDFVAALLPGECCERCVPWEYANAPSRPQAVQDPRAQPSYDPYAQQQQQQNRVDVYIYGPDEGARVSRGQDIYFDCEAVSSYQNAQPRWSRGGNQQLPQKVQSTPLPGNRKLVRLTIPQADQSDAGRYECTTGTGGAGDQASIDLQITEGGYYPRPQPQPQPQPQPAYPNYDPYYQYPNQPGYYPPQPQPQPQPGYYPPQPQPQPQPQPRPQPGEADEENDGDENEDQDAPAGTTTKAPSRAAEQQEGGEDEGEYPEDYTENE